MLIKKVAGLEKRVKEVEGENLRLKEQVGRPVGQREGGGRDRAEGRVDGRVVVLCSAQIEPGSRTRESRGRWGVFTPTHQHHHHH